MLTDILDKIMTIFGVKQDSDAKGKKLIKDIKKNLKKNSKFFNTKKDEVTTQMAQFFYNIYRVVSPYADLLDNIESSKELKSMIVENFISDDQKASVNRLSSDSIIERLAKSKNVKVGASQIHKEIVSLVSSFSSELTNEINDSYALILVFKELACFNYYFMLKKFDSKLPNYDFVYKPSFSDISGSYISDDLKDFLEILEKISIASNWKDMFTIFNNYRSNLSVDNKGWNKVLKSLADAKKSFSLIHIAQVIDENPFYVVESRFDNSSIVEDYINSIRADAEESLKSVLRQRKDIAIAKYVDLIFGDASVTERNKFYTKSANITYEKKELEGFKYVDPINFMRAYFLDYFKTETKNVIEILLIQGQWATNVLSQELSEAFHQVQESLPKTIDLDNSLADDQPNGGRIKAMLRKSGKDMIAKNALDSELKTINAQAKSIINTSLTQLVTIGNIIKSILEEFKAGKVGIIVNWKDIQGVREVPLEELMLTTYKKLFYMVQLIQQSMKES